MHVPDGFLNGATSLATGALSAGGVAATLRATGRELDDRRIPLAGVSAAFVFAAQMVNFPVAAGTTGHLLGGALAAVLLGPSVGALVVTVVVAVQALLFADGGLTALGTNVLNMAIVTAFGGYAAFVLLRRVLPASINGISTAAGLAAAISVVLSSMAFSLEWLFGATVQVPFPTVFGAVVGVHALIGVGEGLITALTVRSVLGARPDLVAGAYGMDLADERPVRSLRTVAIAGILASFVVAMVVSQFSSGDPDGLQRAAEDTGIATAEADHPLAGGIFAGYATEGIDDPTASLAVAGAAGTLLVLAVGSGIALATRSRRRGAPSGDRRPVAG